MSGSGKAGNGRGNSRRHPFRRREKNNDTWQEEESLAPGRNNAFDKKIREPAAENQGRQNRGGFSKRNGDSSRKERAPFIERPKWTPPKMNTDPLPVPDCPWCGKPIRDLSQAITDKDTGVPVHFDCVAARIGEGERLEKGDTISYIGGGRFGIVCFGGENSQDRNTASGRHDFKIKKIIEWENKDKRAEWRSVICDHYSIT